MACALIEAVVDIIESEGLLANVRARAQQLRETSSGSESVQGRAARRPADPPAGTCNASCSITAS